MTDLNGDGILDLITGDCYDAAYLLGNGDGTFQGEQHLTLAGPAPKAVALTDFNADGQPDLVFADQGDQSGTNGFVVALGNAFPRLSVAPPTPTLSRHRRSSSRLRDTSAPARRLPGPWALL